MLLVSFAELFNREQKALAKVFQFSSPSLTVPVREIESQRIYLHFMRPLFSHIPTCSCRRNVICRPQKHACHAIQLNFYAKYPSDFHPNHPGTCHREAENFSIFFLFSILPGRKICEMIYEIFFD